MCFSPPPKVFPKTCFVFPIFIGGEACFYPLLLFIGEVVSIFYRVELFCVPLILYFLLSFIAYVYSLLSCICQYVTKRGRFWWKVRICVENTRMFCLRGVGIVFENGRKLIFFGVSNLVGELVCIFFVFLFFCFLSTHVFMRFV